MKSVFITGASRGIGRAIALEFAKEPTIFFTTYNTNLEAMTEVHKLLCEKHCIDFPFKLNVTNRRDINNAMSHFKGMDTKFGIDVLINNAGIVKDRTLAKMTDEEWDEVIATNLTGVYNVTKAVLPYMNANGGSIINITSIIGELGAFGQTNYAASKAGVIGFTKSLAKELAYKNIRVNCVAGGFTETDMTKNMPPEVAKQVKLKIPLLRFAKPEEIAKAVKFLAEQTYITGEVLRVDGGYE